MAHLPSDGVRVVSRHRADRASSTRVSTSRASGAGTPTGHWAATDSTSRKARNGFDLRCTALAIACVAVMPGTVAA